VFGREWVVVGLLACVATSCRRVSTERAATATPSSDASGDGGPSPSSVPSLEPRTEADFSAPIAATRMGTTRVVAGLVAAKGLLRVVGWPHEGPAWTTDALTGVAWTADAELRLDPAGDGIAVVWHGSFGGRPTHTVVLLGSRGEPRGAPVEVGGSSCATAAGLVWLDAAPHGPAHARARTWGDATVHDVAIVPSDRAASVLCGDNDAFLLGDGDDDLTSTTFSPEERQAAPPTVVIRDSDFGDDDERDHRAFTTGDTLGLVRVSGSGAIALRDVSRSGASPWRRLKHKIGPDDDVVAADGDGATTLVVFTHDVDEACEGGSTAERARVLRADRAAGQDALFDLARADCRVARGPFWVAGASGGAFVAWVERSGGAGPGSAPIEAIAFGAAGGASPAGRMDLAADAVVQGGCDGDCWAAALVRAPDADASQPEAIVLRAFP